MKSNDNEIDSKENGIIKQTNENNKIIIVKKQLKYIELKGNNKYKNIYLGKLMGKGKYSSCYEYYGNKEDNKEILACKIVPKINLASELKKKSLINEIKLQKNYKHPHIANYIDYFEDNESVFLISELCKNNTLEQLIQHRQKLTELEVQCYLFQIIKALKYLHSNHIIHRDLQLSNIFLTDKVDLKIGDFSFATQLKEGESKKTACGNPNYYAPEMIENKNGYSYKVDIWSLGIIMYKLIIGKYPFEAGNNVRIYTKIKNNEYSFPECSIISEDAQNLIKSILVQDPTKRPSLNQILCHDFFIQSKSIPHSLPNSTMNSPPSLEYIKNYMPDVGTDFIVKSKNKNYFIIKWIDYTSNYGLGYLLNNGYYGALFNDGSSMFLNRITNMIYYIAKNNLNDIILYNKNNINDYPNEIIWKINALEKIVKYLNKTYTLIDEEEINIDSNYIDKNCLVMVNKWKVVNENILFEYSNSDIHGIFFNKTDIIISKESRMIIYIKSNGEKHIYPMSTYDVILDKDMLRIINKCKKIFTH